jgi:hypothetical protein
MKEPSPAVVVDWSPHVLAEPSARTDTCAFATAAPWPSTTVPVITEAAASCRSTVVEAGWVTATPDTVASRYLVPPEKLTA